jgi:putative membrane protein
MPNSQDLAFVQQATASGAAEVIEGQIAVEKSLIARNFGQRMVADHTAANNQLRAIAAQEHIPQSPVLTGPEQQDIVTLEILSDPKFTWAYADMGPRPHTDLEAVPSGNEGGARSGTGELRAAAGPDTDAAP